MWYAVQSAVDRWSRFQALYYCALCCIVCVMLGACSRQPDVPRTERREEQGEATATLTREFYKRFNTQAPQGVDDAKAFLLALPPRDKRAVAKRIASDTNRSVHAVGIGVLLQNGSQDDAVCAMAEHIVAGRDDFGRYVYAWMHTGEEKVGVELYVRLNRYILDHLQQYESSERTNALSFLRGVGTSAVIKESNLEALKRRVEAMEKAMADRPAQPTNRSAK